MLFRLLCLILETKFVSILYVSSIRLSYSRIIFSLKSLSISFMISFPIKYALYLAVVSSYNVFIIVLHDINKAEKKIRILFFI